MNFTNTDLSEFNLKLQELIENEMDITKAEDFMRDKNRFHASFALDDPKKIAYFKEYEGYCWDVDIRKSKAVMTKTGKFFRYLFPDVADCIVQKLTAKWYAIISPLLDDSWHFEISEDIKYWYHKDRYFNCSGSLGCSCMRYSSCQEYLDFYENYPIKIIVLKNTEDKIKGRALLWENVYFPKLDKTLNFMDRVYIHSDNDIELFLDYAKEHGFVYKHSQSYSYKNHFVYEDNNFYDTIKIDGNETYYVREDVTPYLDTLTYSTDDGDLCNCQEDEYYNCLESTDGRIQPQYVCDICGEVLNEDNYMSMNYDDNIYCESCFHASYSYCEECGEYHSNDCVSYLDNYGHSVCEDCLDRYYFQCTNCDEWTKRSAGIFETVDNDYICEHCAENSYILCEECGLYEKERYMVEIEGFMFCSYCGEEKEKAIEKEKEE